MPRLKLDYEDAPYRRYGQQTGNGLRSNRYAYTEDGVPRTQREKDDRFDMYRNDQPLVRRTAAPRVKKGTSNGPKQLWYIACLICALGSFCLFTDSIIIELEDWPMRLTSLEVLLKWDDLSGYGAGPIKIFSALPIAFIGMFAAFAIMKEKVFEKAPLVMIALPVAVIVLDIYLAKKITVNTLYFQMVPGTSPMIQVACCIGLIIVVACQRIMCFANVKKSAW
jgi:hypothetical protein